MFGAGAVGACSLAGTWTYVTATGSPASATALIWLAALSVFACRDAAWPEPVSPAAGACAWCQATSGLRWTRVDSTNALPVTVAKERAVVTRRTYYLEVAVCGTRAALALLVANRVAVFRACTLSRSRAIASRTGRTAIAIVILTSPDRAGAGIVGLSRPGAAAHRVVLAVVYAT